MANLFRVSTHPLVRWWWSMDRTTFILLLSLMALGGMVVATASTAVASSYDVDGYYFAKRQVMFLLASVPVMVVLSFFTSSGIRVFGGILFIVCVLGLVLTLVMGADVKGASRWIHIMGFSLQPTEFLKPAFIIVTAALLASKKETLRNRGFFISMLLLGVLGLLILAQPDFGMCVMLGTVWLIQSYLAGISFIILLPLILVAMVVVTGVYFTLPHVQARIDSFLNPASGDMYQVNQARDALLSGSLTGRGAGEGIVKERLPDAHTDFIFAVMGEEFGIWLCLVVIAIYLTIVFRCFSQILDKKDRFVLIAGSGLVILFALQALVNIAVVLHLIPTTGMTLPFISYGGSATIAMAVVMGFVFAFIRGGKTRAK